VSYDKVGLIVVGVKDDDIPTNRHGSSMVKSMANPIDFTIARADKCRCGDSQFN
jgi:hypothetical protein